MKDLTLYALCAAAVLIAAVAVSGLLASRAVPVPPGASQPQATVAQTGTPRVAATMNIPF